MKRILVAMALILLVSTFGIAAAGDVTAGVTPSNGAPRVGESVTITAWIETGGRELGSFSGSLVWDPALLRYDSYAANMPGWMEVVNATQVGTGKIIFVGANAQGQVGTVVPIVVTFTPLAPGQSMLDLTYKTMAEARTFAKIAPVVQDGVLTIGAPSRSTSPTAIELRSFGARRGLFVWLR
jgi:hypothetical protein